MAGAHDLADLIQFAGRFGPGGDPASGQGGQGDIGFHQAVVTRWDARTGENELAVAGGVVRNVPVLSTADSIMLTEGDSVGVIRFKSTYFILGRIAAPGGGAQLTTRQGYADLNNASTTSSSYVNLGGPTVSDVYVGTSRRALVFFSTQAACANAWAESSIAVSGSSSIPAGAGGSPVAVGGFDLSDSSAGGDVYVGSTGTAIQVFDESVGLNPGANTFTMLYRRTIASGYTPSSAAVFRRSRIVVLPY